MGEVYGYPRGLVRRDLTLVGSVAALLALVHLLLAAPIRRRLAFRHGTIDPVTLYTSAFVHADWTHLLGNVAGYLAAAVVAYGLCLQAGRRRWFLATFAGFLLLYPWLVGLVSFAILGWLYPGLNPITRGFSGIGAAFAGFVFVALVAVIRREHDRRTAVCAGLAVWLLVPLEISVIYAGRLLLPVAGAAVVGWGLCLYGLAGDRAADPPTGRECLTPRVVETGMVVLLLVTFVYALFPAEVVGDGAVTNVVAHGAGFLLGIGGAALSARAVTVADAAR